MGKTLFPAVLRVKVLKKMTGKNSVQSAANHNSRARGDFRHTDTVRASDNQILYGSADAFQDVQQIVERYGLARKDSPPANEIIMTAAAEFFSDKTPAQIREWARDSLDFALAEFDGKGKGRVAHADLHMDEAAPHLHIFMVPVCDFTVKNRHGEKVVTKVNHAGVLGKPRGGYPKGTPPSETKLGRLQTAYADAMAKHGLVRGQKDRRLPDGQRLVSTSPYTHRQRMYEIARNALTEIKNLPDKTLVPREQAIRAAVMYSRARVSELKEINAQLNNKVDALEQVITATAKELGCPEPAQLHLYASDICRVLLADTPDGPERLCSLAVEGAEIRRAEAQRQAEEEAARKLIEEQARRSRRKPGQRATKEERRAIRAARKMCPDWKIARQHQLLTNEVYHVYETQFHANGVESHQ